MWERLRQADIVLAKQQLRQRVDETLLRHAEELKQLDHDETELEGLKRLLDEFSRKFKGGAGDPAAAPAAPSGAKTAAAKEAPPGADQPQTAAAAPEEPANAPPNKAAAPKDQEEPVAMAPQEETTDAAPDKAAVPDEPEEPADTGKKKQSTQAAAKEAPILPDGKTTEKAAKPRNGEPRDRDRDKDRDRPRTNFDVFSRAMAKQDRW